MPAARRGTLHVTPCVIRNHVAPVWLLVTLVLPPLKAFLSGVRPLQSLTHQNHLKAPLMCGILQGAHPIWGRGTWAAPSSISTVKKKASAVKVGAFRPSLSSSSNLGFFSGSCTPSSALEEDPTGCGGVWLGPKWV